MVLTAPTIAQDLPPGDPLPGECFARVIVPAQYELSTETVVTRQAGEELRKIPARFETVTERVLVQEESYELVPAGTGGGSITIYLSPAAAAALGAPGAGGAGAGAGGGAGAGAGGGAGSIPFTVDSARNVYDSSGRRVGTVDASGNVLTSAEVLSVVVLAAEPEAVQSQPAELSQHLNLAA